MRHDAELRAILSRSTGDTVTVPVEALRGLLGDSDRLDKLDRLLKVPPDDQSEVENICLTILSDGKRMFGGEGHLSIRGAIDAIDAAPSRQEQPASTCIICGKFKGQSPEGCNGHYEGTSSAPVEPTRNSALLQEFVTYCHANPEQRFWQALRNWAGARFIRFQVAGDYLDGHLSLDTFHWEGKTGIASGPAPVEPSEGAAK